MWTTDAGEWLQAKRGFSSPEIGETRKSAARRQDLAGEELADTVC